MIGLKAQAGTLTGARVGQRSPARHAARLHYAAWRGNSGMSVGQWVVDWHEGGDRVGKNRDMTRQHAVVDPAVWWPNFGGSAVGLASEK